MGNNGGPFRNLVKVFRWMFRLPAPVPAGTDNPELPGDPYAYVGAPKKPRPPFRGTSAVAEIPEP
jgi:hypothetical protein